MKKRLMNPSEYARHRGVTPRAVIKALEEGRITAVNDDKRCIDPEVADIQWAKNTRSRAASTHAPQKTNNEEAGVDYLVFRARREQAEAIIAELKAAQMTKELVHAHGVRMAIYKAFRMLRDTLQALPRRTAHDLHRQEDVRSVEEVLAQEMRVLLDDFERKMLGNMEIGGEPVEQREVLT